MGILCFRPSTASPSSAQAGFWDCGMLSREDCFLSRTAQYVKPEGEETPEGPGEQLSCPASAHSWWGISAPQRGGPGVEGRGFAVAALLGFFSFVLYFCACHHFGGVQC